MKKQYLFYAVISIVLLALASCGTTSPTPTASPATPTTAPTALPDSGRHFLVDDGGQAQIKRPLWNSYQTVSFGAAVQRGDLILPAEGTAVTILCADLSVQSITQEGGVPCQVAEPALFWDGERMVNPRAPGDAIPYILYPRRTSIIEAHPLLQWHDTGASGYAVALVEDGRAIWQERGVPATQLRYPDDAPPLEPSATYLLEITDEDTGKSSSEDPAKGLGFQLLAAEEAAAIQQKREEMMDLPLAEAGRLFGAAVYYAGQGLYGDALTFLDKALAIQESPPLWLWRGDLLIAIRLNDGAQTAYTAAATLAETSGDVESQAQAQAKLWQMTGDEGYGDTAVALYEQLGDADMVAILENQR